MRRALFIVLLICMACSAGAQVNNYWSQNFNDGSSMLAGAVVGGGAGVAAIYYNPANISEITESRLSFSLSLFSLDVYKMRNALGSGIDLGKAKMIAQPRFVSYLIDLPNNDRINLELAFMNVSNSNIRVSHVVDKEIDVLTRIPGNERYFSSFIMDNQNRNDYIGGGMSYQINDGLWIGSSMFLSVKTLKNLQDLQIEASPLKDTIYINNDPVPYYSAVFQKTNEVRFQNYSLLWKFGLSYEVENIRLGVNITTPSINMFSAAEYVGKKQLQSNISDAETGVFLPDYAIIDAQKKRDVKVRVRTPFAASLGLTFSSPDVPGKSFFATVEFFSGVSTYTMLDAKPYPYPMMSDFSGIDSTNYMDLYGGARDLVNVALGYRWKISGNILLMSGLKTDFNFMKGLDIEDKTPNKYNLNIYHVTSGLRFKLEKNVVLFGIQYSFGWNRNIRQIVNFDHPAEYNAQEGYPLVGNRHQTMDLFYNSISFFLGATLNFTKTGN